jgi:hypothetical protein
MGRYKSYRDRIKFETLSVESKSLKSLLCQELRKEFGLSKMASEVLSMRSLSWLQELNSCPLPGQLLLSVPSSPIKKYALSSRIQVKMTVVDVSTDGEVWREFGLSIMQKYRALRLIYEVWRQGGWVSYAELSCLLNLTITALSNRLRDLKEFGVWLPHVGNQAPGENQDYLFSVLVKRFLSGTKSEMLREKFGLTLDVFELYLRNAVTIWELKGEGYGIRQISEFLGLRTEEISSLLSLISDYQNKESWQSLYQCYKHKHRSDKSGAGGAGGVGGAGDGSGIVSMAVSDGDRDRVREEDRDSEKSEVSRVRNRVADADTGADRSVSGASDLVGCSKYKDKDKDYKHAEIAEIEPGNMNMNMNMNILSILEKEHGMPLAVGRVYYRRLQELADVLQREWEGIEGEGRGRGQGQGEEYINEGEMIFLAISAEEGPRTRLSEGKILPVCLEYFSRGDLEIGGPWCKHKNRLCDLKSTRIQRYASQAFEQGALLSLPDIAMLMGIGVDTVRNLIKAKANDGVIIPTRGLIKDIGRGVSHKCKIIELYLQMYTETEIVDRSGHTYESIEAYIKEFARVVILSGSGLNAVMIRQVTGRSMTLVNAYLDLYRKYDENPDYVFRLEHIKRSFGRDRDGDGDRDKDKDKDKETLPKEQHGQAENGKGKGKGKGRGRGESINININRVSMELSSEGKKNLFSPIPIETGKEQS